jgi:7,8-dihydropterin-6-yl-methyl-4-(beta-D-ribofuranosyl)aminobenzene 5'-phosphate synthase
VDNSQVRLTVLSDNTAGEGFLEEWGFSLLVETGGKRILFDTGGSDVAVRNAGTLGIRLDPLDAIVLSHGHADHSGGLSAILREAGPCKIIAHLDVREPRYSLHKGEESPHSIGMPFSVKELEASGASFVLSRQPVNIIPGVMTSGEIPFVTSFESVDNTLLVEKNGVFVQDDMADDLALIITTIDGLIVILGCAHRGVIYILLHARRLTGIARVAAVIGGMHLFQARKERLESTVSGLKEMGVQRLAVSHCTGVYASERLRQEFGEACLFKPAGSQFVLPYR